MLLRVHPQEFRLERNTDFLQRNGRHAGTTSWRNEELKVMSISYQRTEPVSMSSATFPKIVAFASQSRNICCAPAFTSRK